MHSLSSSNYGRLRKKAVISTVAALVTMTMLLLWSSSSFDTASAYKYTQRVTTAPPSLESPTKSSMALSHSCPSSIRGICDLIKPLVHPVAAESFTSRTGKVYQLPSKSPRFTHSLGKKILILDVENRALNSSGGLLDKEKPSTDELQGLTFGRLNHYIFAMLHGYEYQLVQTPVDTVYQGGWHKVPSMRQAIKTYDWVVCMDGDAIFTHLHLPLEWLMNRWEISSDKTLSLALDPDNNPIFFNSKGDVNLNSGFMIAHQTPRSEELLDAWITCPDDTRYEGCAKWRSTHTHDQAVLDEYIRYDYPDEIKALSCTEANRYPGSDDCEGEFVSHFWPFKEMLPGGAKEVFAQYFFPPLQQAFSHDGDQLVIPPPPGTVPLV